MSQSSGDISAKLMACQGDKDCRDRVLGIYSNGGFIKPSVEPNPQWWIDQNLSTPKYLLNKKKTGLAFIGVLLLFFFIKKPK